MDSVGQILSRQDKDGCYTKEKKKEYETMKPKRISKEEILRLMEEKKQLKEVSYYSKTAYFSYMSCLARNVFTQMQVFMISKKRLLIVCYEFCHEKLIF